MTLSDKQSHGTPKKVGFVSLGCPKALVDSERMMTQLREDGYALVPNYQDADVVVVNTCGFIDSAKAESLSTIGDALEENGKVIVTGCLGAKEDEIREKYPNVLSISGPQQYQSVLDTVREHAPQQPQHDPFRDLIPPQGIKLTPAHYAYLKISEGCNHHCSFCIIPSMRGKLASRPIDEVYKEAATLKDNGVQELLVVSQDTSAYGSDLKYPSRLIGATNYRSNFVGLCEALGSLEMWIRLHYVYPYPHVDAVIPLMAAGVVLPYLDIPFQHASPAVLKNMRRPAAASQRQRDVSRVIPLQNCGRTFHHSDTVPSNLQTRAFLPYLQKRTELHHSRDLPWYENWQKTFRRSGTLHNAFLRTICSPSDLRAYTKSPCHQWPLLW